jgi:hypothetical protein
MEAEPEASSWRTRKIADHRRAVRDYTREATEYDHLDQEQTTT